MYATECNDFQLDSPSDKALRPRTGIAAQAPILEGDGSAVAGYADA